MQTGHGNRKAPLLAEERVLVGGGEEGKYSGARHGRKYVYAKTQDARSVDAVAKGGQTNR